MITVKSIINTARK